MEKNGNNEKSVGVENIHMYKIENCVDNQKLYLEN